ncbi:DUF3168 domain-containing protein [uncultured Ralstonia sp.]|jgi:hypothetical protein|uniref:DUF3168 domain-containing protein n=1 Tax=Ralstonia sp. TaxID=54061 RepID=UPI001EA9B7ED|nr:DUF3168 domain-containing protein [uncultured Ralstonia sp.]UCF25461.1 MAG: DUF3168 domain-containing protein [Ralstonia sp.]
MPTIQEQLVSQLEPVVPGGIYPLIAEQNVTPPYAVYQRIASAIENTLAGNGQPPIFNTRFQIDVWDITYASGITTCTAIKAAMAAWTVQNVLILEHDEYVTDVRRFRFILDFSVWHY